MFGCMYILCTVVHLFFSLVCQGTMYSRSANKNKSQLWMSQFAKRFVKCCLLAHYWNVSFSNGAPMSNGNNDCNKSDYDLESKIK